MPDGGGDEGTAETTANESDGVERTDASENGAGGGEMSAGRALITIANHLSSDEREHDRFIRNLLASRAGHQFDGDRDLYETLGYDEKPQPEDYWALYLRNGLARRIVDAAPNATFRRHPKIRDPGVSENETSDFERQVRSAVRSNNAWHHAERADRLTGVGRYSVILIGVRDGRDLSDPMAGVAGNEAGALESPDEVLYFSNFREAHAEVTDVEDDGKSPRFGRPTRYDLTIEEREDDDDLVEQDVHWTRVVHVVEDPLEDEIEGRPRLEPVLNRLDDIMKSVGGSAEMFFQNVAGFYLANVSGGANVDQSQLDDMRDQLKEAMLKLRRVVGTQGLEDFEHVGGGEADPSGLFDVLISLVSAATGIPQRILLGSERGELASSQDAANWLGRMSRRQVQYAEPRIVRPIVDRLVASGAVDAPEDDGGMYEVHWPDLFQLNALEKASLLSDIAAAANDLTPTAGNPREVITIDEAREMIGLPPRDEVDEPEIQNRPPTPGEQGAEQGGR